MRFETIDEIYDANDRIRQELKELLAGINEEERRHKPGEGKWSIAEIVEHLQMVEHSMVRISAKLIEKAKANGHANDGEVAISPIFADRSVEMARSKLEAPEFVRPGGDRSVDDSIAAMDLTREKCRELKELFEAYNGNIYKFPHPFFGELSAIEWLGLIGAHEQRHIRQIRNILSSIRGQIDIN